MATGTAIAHQNENFKAEKLLQTSAPNDITTAGAATYTAAQILGGVITRDPNGAARTDKLPTAANLVAAVPKARIGDTIDVLICNTSDSAATTAATELLTISAGTGGAFATPIQANAKTISKAVGNANTNRNSSKLVRIRLTAVASGSEAYVVYM